MVVLTKTLEVSIYIQPVTAIEVGNLWSDTLYIDRKGIDAPGSYGKCIKHKPVFCYLSFSLSIVNWNGVVIGAKFKSSLLLAVWVVAAHAQCTGMMVPGIA